MSDQHETLAAIIAEMREAGRSSEHADGPLIEDYADRIEAAAERERDEDRQLAAIAESDEAFARCARCDRPERAPGNAAALSEALGEVLDKIDAWRTDGSMEHWQYSHLFDICDAALSAPARNCDRFQNWHDAMREEYFTRSTPENVKGYPYGDEKRWREFCDWLFAQAKGGDHA